MSDEILFVIGGGGKYQSAALSILKQLKNHKINILYIKPDVAFLGQQSLMLDNLVFNVFQEYARSGVFERLYVVDNACMEKVFQRFQLKIIMIILMMRLFQHFI